MKNYILKNVSKELKEWCHLNKFVGKKLQIAYVDMDAIIEFRKRPKIKTYTEMAPIIYLDDVGE